LYVPACESANGAARWQDDNLASNQEKLLPSARDGLFAIKHEQQMHIYLLSATVFLLRE
jgi:hypothetical protein